MFIRARATLYSHGFKLVGFSSLLLTKNLAGSVQRNCASVDSNGLL
jgi:hypothetical protein